jgi:ERCC4-type nuclease
MANPDSLDASTPLHVVIDHREAASATAAALLSIEGIAAEFGHLTVGDYHVGGTFVFERKTLVDFAASVLDGRLFRQTLTLAELPSRLRGVLILEGGSGSLSQSGMSRESLQGALITVSLFFGVPVLRSLNGEESARLMLYAARQAKKYSTRALPRFGKRPKGKRKAQIALLQEIPGLGPGRAERLLERFGSVEAVLTADIEELTTVAGVGKHTATTIRWLVSEAAPPSYGAR